MVANSFIADYEVIRALMHAVLRYGTLTPEQLDISPSKYNKMKPLLEAVMQDNIEDRRYRKGAPRTLHITADTFSQGLTALSNTYMVRSIKVTELMLRLVILQELSAQGSMSTRALTEAVLETVSDAADSRTVLRQCQHLAEYGQIRSEAVQNKLVWSLTPALLQEMPGDTADMLGELVSFLRLYQAPSLCGEQLFRTLCSTGDAEQHFLVTGVSIGYVLDDAVLYALLRAIEARRAVKFDYIDQKREKPDFSQILPLRIHSCEALGRRFLVGLDLMDGNRLILCRLDFITNVRMTDIQPDIPQTETDAILARAFRYSVSGAHLPEDGGMRVRLKCAPEYAGTLMRQFPDAEWDAETETAVLTVNHALELKAYLREHAVRADGTVLLQPVPGESCGLYEDMQNEAALWRERYGIES